MPQHPFARGLAVSAVAALAVTGLASAAQAADPTATLVSQFSHRASLRPIFNSVIDGNPLGVTLTAHLTDPTAAVAFEYNLDAGAGDGAEGWTTISPASGDGSALTVRGDFATQQWNGEGAAGRTVAIRVAATVDGATTYSTRHDVTVTAAPPVDAVALGKGTVGYFTQPYTDSHHTSTLAAVSGRTTATDGDVQLSWWRESDGTFQGQTNAAVSAVPSKISTGTGTDVDTGDFTGALDISAFDAQDGAVLPVAAQRDSDDVEPLTLRQQTIGYVGYAAFGDRTADGTLTTLTVFDTANAPVVGAEVRRSSNGSLVGYTDVAGQVSTRQRAGTTGEYYVNATDADGYDAAAGDVSTGPVETPDYAPQATSTVAVLADGDAFDTDEYTTGDIALQVVDQEGTPYASRSQVSYRLYRTGSTPTAAVTATADASGRIVIPFDASQAGSYTLDYGTPEGAASYAGFSTTFTVGDSTLSLSPGVGAARSGGAITYTGSLAVHGKPLPGRRIDLRYTRGTELAPGVGADAGIGATHALAASAVTDADGTFTVTVQDPAEAGNPTETGGRLTARTAPNVASAGSTLSGDAAETAVASVDFGAGKGRATVHLSGKGRKARADRLTVTGSAGVAGARVVLYREGRHHEWLRVAGADLDARDVATFTVRDRNGKRATRYKVTLRGTSRLQGATSNTLRLS